MRTLIVIVAILTVWATLIGLSLSAEKTGIKCWVCNSRTDPNCADYSFNGEISRTVQKLDCSDAKTQEVDPDWFSDIPWSPPTACVKIISEGRTKEDPSILIRGCYRADPLQPSSPVQSCKTTRSSKGTTTVCTCKEDYCNGTGSHWLSVSVILVAVIPFIRIL